MNLRVALILAACAVAECVGCGSQPAGTFQVSGTVTLDGAPLDQGGIRFSAVENDSIAGAMIRNGAYRVPAEKGLPPGTYRVEINSADESAPPIMAYGVATAPNRIPEEYNVKSDKTIEVTAEGANEFAFDIRTK